MRTILLVALIAPAAYEAQPLEEAAPAPVSDRVRQELAPRGIRVLGADKKPFVDLWLRKAVPEGAARDLLGVRFPTMKDGVLVGVAKFHTGGAEFRGLKIAPGVYTLRYATQPEDGDHQGTVESRDFLLLGPAADDASPDPVKLEDAIKLSGKVSGKKHPSVLWLMKVPEDAKLPRAVHDATAERVVCECEVPSAASGGKPVRLGIVVVGKAPDF